MKSFKGKVAILVSVLSVIFCFCLFFGVNQNVADNQPQTNEQESSVEQQPASTISKALPQSADEVFNAIPSKETLDNLPGYINKSIELLDKESAQNTNVSSNNDPKDTSPSFLNIFRDGEVHKIYACLKKTDDTFKLILTAVDPSVPEYEAVYEISDQETLPPKYCEEYSTKISSVEIDQSVENFHPISTVQWFGSYIESSSQFDCSKLTSISGLRFLKMDKVKNSAFMFSGTKNLTNLDAEDIEYIKNTTNYFPILINASGMFIESGLDSDTLDMFLTKFCDSPCFKSCQYTFALCNNFKKIISPDIKLSYVQNASSMFSRSGLESFDNNIKFGKLDNPNIYAITAIFYECHNLKNVDVSDMFNYGTAYYTVMDGSVVVDKVSSAVSAFQSCEKLTYVDLGNWDVSNKDGAVHLNYMTDMFSGCSSLTTIATRYDANWIDFVKDSSNMFAGCKSLVGQNRTTYKDANIHAGFARIDDGKSNPGYFTLSKNSPEPPKEEFIYSLGDETQNGVSYLPVCDETHQLSPDLTFYDGDMNKINPSNSSYYVMSDLKEAKYFTGSSPFPVIRAQHSIKQNDLYDEDRNVRQTFIHQYLTDGEQVLVFKHIYDEPPKYNEILLSTIFDTYEQKLSNDALYWSNRHQWAYNAHTKVWVEYTTEEQHEVAITKTLNPKDMEPKYSPTSCFFDYDDSIVEKITNVTGDKTYPKNTKFNYNTGEFKFKVVMKDGASVSRAFDGINELKDDNGVFTIDNRYGMHSIYVDRQTKFTLSFEKDDWVYITDKDGNIISTPIDVQINQNFEFKIKDVKQKEVIKEVKVDNQIIEPDHLNCYEIKNIINDKKVVISSQMAEPLFLYKGENLYSYYPVFDKLSANQIKFYDNEGKYIWPTANDGHDYIMSDLKNVQTYIGSGYKFQAIRINQDKWSSFDEKDGKATKYNGDMIDGDCCASLSFDKGNDRPLVGGVFIGDIINSYENFSNIRNFWGSDVADTENSYLYELNDTKDKGSWKPSAKDEVENVVIQHEFSDCYSVKFECDSGVIQIIDENGNDISNGAIYSKDKNFKFKIKCVDDCGTNIVEQSTITIDGHQQDPVSLQLDNNSLMYTTNNSEDLNATGCVIKISTTNVSSFKTDKGLYHPVFDNEDPEKVKFYDNDGQCLTPTKRYPGDAYDRYIMNDAAYATKYKFIQANDNEEQKIHAVRTIKEGYWDHIFDIDEDEGDAKKFTEEFKNKLSEGDTAIKFPKSISPDVKQISLYRIYEAYKNTGFGHNGSFNYWTNSLSVDSDFHFGAFFDRYSLDDKDTVHYYYNDKTTLSTNVDNCFMVVEREFVKTDPSCTVVFHADEGDEGIDKITDVDDNVIDYNIPIEIKSDNFKFRVYYKEGYVENQTKDGTTLLTCDNDNTYTVNNIKSQRVVKATSKKAKTLKCSDTSKHPGLSYKPIFNKLSVNDVKFYDQNGHFMSPSQDNGTNYIMNDLKNNVAYFINNGSYNFKAVLITEHTWDEAFGQDIQGKATNYIAGDNEFFEECANLNFAKDQTPFIYDVKLSDIQKCYFENDSFYWGNYAQNDKASRYSIVTTEFWDDVSRSTNGSIVLSRTYKDIYTINFNKDVCIEKFVDVNGQEINGSVEVSAYSDFRFKPIVKEGYAAQVSFNNKNMQKDNDGFFTIKNVSSESVVDTKSEFDTSLFVNNKRYYPVGNEFDSNEIKFYDNSGLQIKPSGERESSKFYVMSDLKNAVSYSSRPGYKFMAVRSDCQYDWRDVFYQSAGEAGAPEEARLDYINSLNKGDYVYYFCKDSRLDKGQPYISGVGIQNPIGLHDIVDNYHGSGFSTQGDFWSNYRKYEVLPGGNYGWACDYYNYEKNDMYSTNVKLGRENTDVLIAREFMVPNTHKISFEHSEDVNRFTDEEGKTISDNVEVDLNKDFKFKVVCNDKHAVDKVYANGQLLESNQDGVYTINMPDIDIKVTTSCIETQSLVRNGDLYHPIFDKAYFDDVVFYDKDGNICKGNNEESFTMSDITNAVQYVAKSDYKFKAIKVLDEQRWDESFGFDVKDRATQYIKPLGPEELCTTLSFVHNDGDLYVEDFNQNKIFVKDLHGIYFKDSFRFWTSTCSKDKSWGYILADSSKGMFTEWEKDFTASLLFESVFSNDTCKVNFDYDENILKATTTNGSSIDKSFDYSIGSDLKFKVVANNGHLVDNVYVNNEKILPNNDGVYVVQHISKDVNINIDADEAHSLMCGEEVYHPVCSYIPSTKVKFYDKDQNYIHASGNNGLSYLMSDLINATQFVSKDYTFEAVAMRDQSWKVAFGELEGSGVASTYIPHIEGDQICTSLKFDELNINLYISGISVDDIVKVYFGGSKCWSPISQDTDAAYYYDNKQWIKDSKTNSHAILLQKTFSSIEKTRVNFEFDEGVEYLQSSDHQAFDDYFDFVPGKELKFKISYNNSFVLNSIKFNNEDLVFERDGYFHILMDSSLIGKSSKVDITTQKAHSLKVDDISYKPLYETLSSNDYNFYDNNGIYIKPSNGDDYVMSDLANADKFIYQQQGSYELNAVGIINHKWDEAFGNDTQGKATEYKAGDVDSSIQCSTLTFDKDKDPTVEGFSLTKIKELFPGVREFWGNESNGNIAWSYKCDSGVESGSWLEVRSRTTTLPILMNKKFTSFSTIHFEKDLGIKDFISDDGSAFAAAFTMQSDNRLRFKVALNDTFVLDSLTINGKPASADSEGYYTIDNVNSFKLVKAESVKAESRTNIKFIKNEGIEKLVDANDQELPENVIVKKGSDFRFKVVCKQNFNNEYVMINNQPILKDYDDFYTIKNIASSVNVAASSYSNKHSLIVENDLYHPAFDKISNEKILFYDDGGKLIQATGDDVQGREGYKYYLSNDTVDASYYAISDDLTSFTAVRSVNNVHWNDAFDENSTLCRDVKNDFRRQHLHTGDSPYIFNYDQSEIVDKPKINGIELTSLYNIYNKHGFGTYNAGGHFLVNWQYALGYPLAYYWDSANNKLSESQQYDTSNVDVVITREFSNKINVQKDKGIKEFVDINGDTITRPIYVGYDKHLNFKTVCNDRLKRKQVTFNGR